MIQRLSDTEVGLPELAAPVCEGVLPGAMHGAGIRLPAVCRGSKVLLLAYPGATSALPPSILLPSLRITEAKILPLDVSDAKLLSVEVQISLHCPCSGAPAVQVRRVSLSVLSVAPQNSSALEAQCANSMLP